MHWKIAFVVAGWCVCVYVMCKDSFIQLRDYICSYFRTEKKIVFGFVHIFVVVVVDVRIVTDANAHK